MEVVNRQCWEMGEHSMDHHRTLPGATFYTHFCSPHEFVFMTISDSKGPISFALMAKINKKRFRLSLNLLQFCEIFSLSEAVLVLGKFRRRRKQKCLFYSVYLYFRKTYSLFIPGNHDEVKYVLWISYQSNIIFRGFSRTKVIQTAYCIKMHWQLGFIFLVTVSIQVV